MAVVNWGRACSKAKVLSLVCLAGVLANFIIFNNYSSSLSTQWGRYDISESNEQIEGTKTRDVAFFINKYKSIQGYSEPEIRLNIRSVLSTLTKSSQVSMSVLKEIILNLRDRHDVNQLLAKLELDNTTWHISPAGNMVEIFNETKTLKSKCPVRPPGLIGNIASNLATVVPMWLEKNYAFMQGGHYAPNDCLAREKTAIIIPYRNRFSHLHILLNNLLPTLIRQQLDFRIFVIEQASNTTFNRAMLLNVGYLEALKIDNFDCFIFHDVDMILINDNCLYRCANHPRHMAAGISKWKYGLLYKSYFGGVVAFTRKQFRNINGCSNLFFGWGGEDDDLRSRLLKYGYKMLRYPKEIGRYDSIPHMRDDGNSPNPDRLKLVNSSRKRQTSEGLSTTKYKVTQVDFKPLYTWIRVIINMTEVLQGLVEKKFRPYQRT